LITDLSKAPFPWFGGKRHAAPAIWEALGDVPHYVEPFMGSLATLLCRPHVANRPYYSETVNDLDGLLVNAWRSIALHPDATAEWASWPVSEADLSARHVWLLRWKSQDTLDHLSGDPTFCDPQAAGWWLWGQSSWIGSGWCSGTGPWTADASGRLVRQARGPRDAGVSRQFPHLGDDGQGVNRPQLREDGVWRQRPQLGDNGRGVNHAGMREEGTGEPDFHPMTMPELRRWFAWLSARLRHVRILHGDWKRAVTGGARLTLSVRQGNGPCGVFLDPPYADTAGRTADVYAHDSESVAHAVREWCLENGDRPDTRIVLAGFEGEHGTSLVDAGWREVQWYTRGFLRGGMGNTGSGGQQKRERLWLSPHCLQEALPEEPYDTLSMFSSNVSRDEENDED
jgi:hypothetical protein